MYAKLNDLMIRAYVMAKMLERGDSDSAGSTMRTMGIIALVIAVVLLIGAAVMVAGGYVAGELNASPFPW